MDTCACGLTPVAVSNIEGVGGPRYISKVCKDENIHTCTEIIPEVSGGNPTGAVF